MAVGAWLIWFGFCGGSMVAQVLNNRIFTETVKKRRIRRQI